MGAKRKMRRPSTRRRLAQRWLDSGVTAVEFAAAHGVTRSSLHRWVRELRDDAGQQSPAGFIEVATVSPRPGTVRLMVGAVTLELDRLPPAEYVLALGGGQC